MKISFSKYHGTGNDFILIDNQNDVFRPEAGLIRRLCHRRFGIGADGLITLNRAEGFDFGMKYYNADGNESTMCGNGGRCIAAYADFLSPGTRFYSFLAADGLHTATITEKTGNVCRVKLSMKEVTAVHASEGEYVIDTGSPHLIKFVENLDYLDVIAEGRRIRNKAEFAPAGINANFVRDEGGIIYVRTYERGVEDETLSCGTGVTASALAYADSRGLYQGSIKINTRGGNLKLHFRREGKAFKDIYLEGPAEKVFDGEIDI